RRKARRNNRATRGRGRTTRACCQGLLGGAAHTGEGDAPSDAIRTVAGLETHRGTWQSRIRVPPDAPQPRLYGGGPVGGEVGPGGFAAGGASPDCGDSGRERARSSGQAS